ncbi:hypothetical protein HYT45_01255 [Candidatus Uhrbacteria bacterium]|nr:hypothetical protein [Candidatus Uhrbacteria bacterium]
MAENPRQREMVLATNEQMFALDRTSGQVLAFRGPYKEALSTDMRPVVWQGGRFMETDGEDVESAIRTFVKATEEQYVILRNPTSDTRQMTAGKNNPIVLQTGKTVVMRGPIEFPLWPGQEAEVIDGHQLREDEYLRIRISGPVASSDAAALWDLVREEWRYAVSKPAPKEGSRASASLPSKQEEGNTAATVAESPSEARFPLGAEYVVWGYKTPFFIPPTGVTVLPTDSSKSRCFVRRGVRLAADEYAVLVNRAGRVSYVYGPTTVIPCVDQEFRNTPIGRPEFKAVAIDENSGVLLRTLAEMTVAEARERVPGAVMTGDVSPDSKLPPGTQLVVWKENRLVFPADGIEIVRKFDSVHIHAGTARYVKNMMTGITSVVRGEKLYLADPRVEQFVERVISEREKGLWFPRGDYDHSLVPCITVPQGTAAMVLGGVDQDGNVPRKVLVGHTVHFLSWDETLATLKISGSKPGQPKDWKNAVEVCFLWTTGNRVNDSMVGRSRDDCEFTLEYTLTVDFDRVKSDDWFAVDDYVYLVCDEVRSRLLGSLLVYPIGDIATNFVNLVRDIILGKKEGEKHRPGIEFARCGAKLVDINVKSFKINDAQLEASLKRLQQAAVGDSIKTREAMVALDGERSRGTIEGERLAVSLALKKAQIDAAVQSAEAEQEKQRRTEEAVRRTEEERIAAAQELAKLRAAADRADAELGHAIAKLQMEQSRELETSSAKLRADLDLLTVETKKTVAEMAVQISELDAQGQTALLAPEMARDKAKMDALVAEVVARAEADAKVNASISPAIAANLRLLAESGLTARVAESLGRSAIFKDMDVMELLGRMAGGAPVVERVIDAVRTKKLRDNGHPKTEPAALSLPQPEDGTK